MVAALDLHAAPSPAEALPPRYRPSRGVRRHLAAVPAVPVAGDPEPGAQPWRAGRRAGGYAGATSPAALATPRPRRSVEGHVERYVERHVGPRADRRAALRADEIAVPRARVLRASSARSSVLPLRLTRRGVVVLALATAALAVALVWLARASFPAAAGAAAAAAAAHAPAVVTVQSGDTLWSVAQRVAPQTDPRAEVDKLVALNHLQGVDVVAGQVLRTR